LLFEENGDGGRGEVVVVSGVFGIGVTRSIAGFEVTAAVVSRAARDNDGLLEAAVERVTFTLIAGSVAGTLTVVAGGIKTVGDIAKFAHTIVGLGEGTLENVSFIVGGDVWGLHHDGAFQLSVGELGSGGVAVRVVNITRVLDVGEFLSFGDGTGRGAKGFGFVPQAEVDVCALTAASESAARRVGIVADVAATFLDRN
jgi:hypothetical protein